MCKKMMLVVAALLLVAVSVQATVNPIAKSDATGTVITLSTGAPSWSADLTTYANFIGDVYAIGGYSGGSANGNVAYEDGADIGNWGMSGPFIKVGPSTGGSYKGWVLYRFALPAGQTTAAGGTITANAIRVNNYDASVTWMGVLGAEIAGASTIDLGGGADEAAFTKTNFPKPAYTWGSYGTLSLDIPTGVSMFYVAFFEEWGSNEKIGYQGLDVNANIIPEPITMVLLGLGGLLIRRK
ncbi:MAG: hypothetical protein ACYC3B_07730 [Sedimentisphaerales bacterium]